jgi:pimeloyl-ACP methyl ester carboxylesterase
MTDASSEFRVQHYVGAHGIRLVADVGGDPSAASVVLLHGGGQTRHSWSGAMRNLVARGYYVVNLDARGHGDSEWASDGDYSFDILAEDVECVIRTMASKPALVGASMGGATALCLIGTKRQPIATTLILVDIVPLIDEHGAAKILAFMNRYLNGFTTVEEVADAVAAYNPHRPRPTDVSGLMKNLRQRTNGRLYWHWDPRVINGPDAREPPLAIAQLKKAADGVRVPTLLVRGLKSDIVTDEGVADLKGRIPSLEVFAVADAGHMVAGDKNDAFNQGILAFLQRRSPPGLSLSRHAGSAYKPTGG